MGALREDVKDAVVVEAEKMLLRETPPNAALGDCFCRGTALESEELVKPGFFWLIGNIVWYFYKSVKGFFQENDGIRVFWAESVLTHRESLRRDLPNPQ